MRESLELNEYINKIKELPLSEKKKITIEEIKELLAFIQKLKTDLRLNSDILFNREILDLNSEEATDDDFVEAVFIYICSIQEALAEYVECITNLLYKESGK